MTQYIAFLRAINVGGHNVKMAELRALFEALGFTRVETFIASGNVIFETDSDDPTALEQRIAAHLEESLGYAIATFIRTPAEVAQVAGYKPFSEDAMATAGALSVSFLAEPPSREQQQALMALTTDIDSFHTHGKEVYWMCAVKQSQSKFSNAVFERKLKAQGTFRGLKTVTRLATKYA